MPLRSTYINAWYHIHPYIVDFRTYADPRLSIYPDTVEEAMPIADADHIVMNSDECGLNR